MALTFNCFKCGKPSQYNDRKAHDRVPIHGIREHKRTYRCEHCGEENVVSLDGDEWVLVDERR